MHEVGIAQEVLKIVEAKASEQGEGRVHKLRLKIGEFSGVETEALRFALEVCSSGTRAEGMSVEIEKVPAQAGCRDCSNTWEFALAHRECPECGSDRIDMVAGHDLTVESFEME